MIPAPRGNREISRWLVDPGGRRHAEVVRSPRGAAKAQAHWLPDLAHCPDRRPHRAVAAVRRLPEGHQGQLGPPGGPARRSPAPQPAAAVIATVTPAPANTGRGLPPSAAVSEPAMTTPTGSAVRNSSRTVLVTRPSRWRGTMSCR